MNVYPAAGLIWYAPPKCPVYLIDPGEVFITGRHNITVIRKKASEGIRELKTRLLKHESETD